MTASASSVSSSAAWSAFRSELRYDRRCLERLDADVGAGTRAGPAEEIADADAVPRLGAAPALDARDRQDGAMTRKRPDLVEGELEGRVDPAAHAERERLALRGLHDAGRACGAVHGEALRADVGSARCEERELAQRPERLADRHRGDQRARAERGHEELASGHARLRLRLRPDRRRPPGSGWPRRSAWSPRAGAPGAWSTPWRRCAR